MEKPEFHFSRNVIKVRLGDEIRRVPILTDELTYNELCSLIMRLFKSQIKEIDRMKLKYFDEDGDLVLLNEDWDVKYALSLPKGLHVVVIVELPALTGLHAEQQRLLKDLMDLKSKIENLLSLAVTSSPIVAKKEPALVEKDQGLKTLSTKEVLEILDLPEKSEKKAADIEASPQASSVQSKKEDAKKTANAASSPKITPDSSAASNYAPAPPTAYPFYPAAQATSNQFIDQYGQQYTLVNGQYMLNPNQALHQGYYSQTAFHQQSK